MNPAPLLLLSLAAGNPSFDCARASASDEQAVCASETLSAQDRRLAILFTWALAVAEAGPSRAAVKAAQVAWLKRRRGCGREAAPTACIEALYQARIGALERLLPEGCPAAVLMSRTQSEPGANGCEERSADWPELVSTALPGAAAFNAFFRRGWDEKCVASKEPPDPDAFTGAFPPGVPGSVEVSYAIRWATPRFITVVFRDFQMTAGAAHPSTTYHATTFDLERGRPVALEDFLVPDPEARVRLAGKVLQLLDRDRLFDETDVATVARVIEQSGVWILDARGATIRFPRYSVGPYAAGDLEVRVPWKELRPWLLPEGVMPPKH
jgi:uncharacterized protein YecT (DUF1311 family)